MCIMVKSNESSPKKRRGATLVEVMMYLGIAAFIIGSAIILYSVAEEKRKFNNFITEMYTISNVANDLTQNQSAHYSSLKSGWNGFDWRGSGLLPNSFFDPNGNIITPWGSGMDMNYWDDHFQIWIWAMPYAVCKNLDKNRRIYSKTLANINTYGCGGRPMTLMMFDIASAQ